MKKITKEYTLYNVNELTQEARDKARQSFNEDNEYTFLSDNLNEKLHELLEENKIKDQNDTSKPNTKPTEVFYSLTNSQGDGCMFAGHFEWNGYTVKIKQSGRYTHSNSKEIEITDEEGNEPETDEPAKAFEAIYQSICEQLERSGYNEIEYENSEEAFIETCEANEYTFLSDGTMCNE